MSPAVLIAAMGLDQAPILHFNVMLQFSFPWRWGVRSESRIVPVSRIMCVSRIVRVSRICAYRTRIVRIVHVARAYQARITYQVRITYQARITYHVFLAYLVAYRPYRDTRAYHVSARITYLLHANVSRITYQTIKLGDDHYTTQQAGIDLLILPSARISNPA